MTISVGGPKSQIEAEAKKKLITEKEIQHALEQDTKPKELRLVKARMRELLDFYDRIIKSIDVTVKTVKSKPQLTNREKHDMYLFHQERELAKAKAEKSKFRRYLKKIEVLLGEK